MNTTPGPVVELVGLVVRGPDGKEKLTKHPQAVFCLCPKQVMVMLRKTELQ